MREEVRWWLELAQKNPRRAERAMEDTDYPEAVALVKRRVGLESP